MRGKNKQRFRSGRDFFMEEEEYSDYYEESAALLGAMSPLSRSAPSHSTVDWKPKATPVKGRNEKQVQYLEHLNNPAIHMVFATGCAGTGKTFLAVSHAMEKLQAGAIKKIVVTRPMVAVDDKHFGALPGDVIAKTMPYIMPVYDVMHKYMSPAQVQALVGKGVIEICPLMYMRGRSFENTFIIADEMQNSSPNQMLMLLTRIGANSKMVITGDPMQHDRGQETSGLVDVMRRLEGRPQDGIETIHFTEQEVERHPMIKKILKLYHTQQVPSV